MVRISGLGHSGDLFRKCSLSLSDPGLLGRTLFRFEHVVDCEASVCYNGHMFYVWPGKLALISRFSRASLVVAMLCIAAIPA